MKRKIGIIGAGAAGLVAAWLLEEECEVLLFEKNNHLGGHAQTLSIIHEGHVIPMEIGFEFFNASLFPYFCTLLDLLCVPIYPFALTHTFYTNEGKKLLFPPVRRPSCLIRNFLTYMQFLYVINAGKKIIQSRSTDITLEAYANSLWLQNSFKTNYLYPLLTAGWGTTINDFKTFAAYDILQWIAKTSNKFITDTWYEIVNGSSTYCTALEEQLQTTKIYKKTEITTLAMHNKQYLLTTTDQEEFVVDSIMVATNPQCATKLLQSLEQTRKFADILGLLESFPATLAIHGDERFMPRNRSDWSISNIFFDGEQSALTFYKPWKSKQLFRSWLTKRTPMPQPLYALQQFEHQKVTPVYFTAQRKLASVQGKDNIWILGHYTHDIDSHENAIVSALLAAKHIAPHSTRLNQINQRRLII